MKTMTLFEYLMEHFGGVSSARRLLLAHAVIFNDCSVDEYSAKGRHLSRYDVIEVGNHWSASII